ncbi:hypothetical protein P7K49_014418 [Saguinus oedipus]|uniref:TRC8-like N-terminal domain-containing protein n=1 Tax=Saguinus oedipus TaxID=9490 RepID=A0ABQ9VL05_SAGOE|nr:hypothetical protein P7K49_014418 [Saguinus oedipus]
MAGNSILCLFLPLTKRYLGLRPFWGTLDYVRSEMEFAYEGPMYLEPLSMNRFTTALIGFSGGPLREFCVLYGEAGSAKINGACNSSAKHHIFRTAAILSPLGAAERFLYSIEKAVVEVYGLLALGMSLWNQLVVPVLFMVFWLVLFALQIYSYFSTRDQPVKMRGMTEGVTLLILAVRTGLIELQVVHRALLLSITLFIVVASILQSMLEIADPIVLALGASRDNSILTSLQVLGTLFIYVLFMVEEFRKEPVENMDDVIYYVNGTYHLLEFLVTLCVVAHGVRDHLWRMDSDELYHHLHSFLL